ncbi:MAG: hypothetical protein B0D92_06735, partial [Spirochaeta sp. LUC14_002_19_P3]
PENFTAALTATAGEVKLTWNVPTDMGVYALVTRNITYKVYSSRSDITDTSGLTPNYIGTDLSYTFTGTVGETWYFAVNAYNGIKDTPLAKIGPFTISSLNPPNPLNPLNPQPSALGHLSFSAYSETGLTVSWKAPSDTGIENGSANTLSGYKVYYSSTSGADLTSVTITLSDANITSQAIGGLSAGTQYSFRVTAFNASGESMASTEAHTYTNKASGSPENFTTALTATAGKAKLTWSAPADMGYTDGSTATAISYKVYSSKSDIADTAGLTPAYTGTDLSYIFTGTVGESWYFAVIANNGGADSTLAKTGPFTLIQPVVHQLHLYPNGGSGPIEITDFLEGVATAIPAPTRITKSGSSIAAWNTAADASGTYYDVTEEITLTAELKLYAVWSTDGLAYSLINDDTEYSVTAGSVPITATYIEVSGYWQGKKVTEVGGSAFWATNVWGHRGFREKKSYTDLTDIKLPPTITVIQNYAFSGCSKLALTSLPDGITSIGDYAFWECTNLALTSLPDGITFIGTAAFYGCTNLALTSLPSGLKRLKGWVFTSCSEVNFTSLPSGLEYIGSWTLYGTKSAFTTLPGSVTDLEHRAFGGTAMSSMTIPATVTRIGRLLFNYNDVITEVTLEGDYSRLFETFANESTSGGKLATVNITNDTTPATLIDGVYWYKVFPNTVRSIKVPASAVDTYKAEWPEYADIISGL